MLVWKNAALWNKKIDKKFIRLTTRYKLLQLIRTESKRDLSLYVIHILTFSAPDTVEGDRDCIKYFPENIFYNINLMSSLPVEIIYR